YYGVQLSSADIFLASFDPASGDISSTPVQPIKQFDGFNQSPEWSPDGKYLAYVSKRDPLTISPITLVIRSMESGKVVRELKPKLGYLLVPRWSPDGRTFIARDGDLKGRSGIVKIDAATGDGSLVVPNEVCSGIPFWASEGTTFFCLISRARESCRWTLAQAKSGVLFREHRRETPRLQTVATWFTRAGRA
ncbi:MAG: hypothetical protein M3P18_14710, partial [Actinomycetota bacterium]|nr:hypothetical protein [Actinomycetota bacterium]